MSNKDNYWKGDFVEFFQLENELRTTVVHPFILGSINNYVFKSVLDFGCGQGDLLNLMKPSDGFNYIGYDPAAKCIENAKSIHANVDYAEFTGTLSRLEPASFDVVVLSFVLITIDNTPESEALMKNAASFLKSSGRLIFCETHPCFRDRAYSTLKTDMDMADYKKSCFPINVTLNSESAGNTVSFVDYHKNLTDIFNCFSYGNLRISRLVELYDCPENAGSSRHIGKESDSPPPFIYIEGVKI